MANFISVIIPVYNDPEGLRDTLDSVSLQDYPKDSFEIIIADNGSKEETIIIADYFIKKFPKLIKIVIENRIRSSYAARNKGIEASKGSIVAFIDADMTVENDWLKNIDKIFNSKQIDYMGCNVITSLKNRSIVSFYSCMNGFYVEKFLRNFHYSPTCCLTVKKDLFKKIGMFDPRIFSGGDNEFGRRSYENGVKQYYHPEIVMYHPARKTLKDTIARSFRFGRGSYLKFFYYPKRCTYKYFKIFNPFIYLPAKPGNFIKYYKVTIFWNHLNVRQKILLYFIDWLMI